MKMLTTKLKLKKRIQPTQQVHRSNLHPICKSNLEDWVKELVSSGNYWRRELFGWKTDCWRFICSKFASKWNESFNCMICVLLYNQAFSFSLDRQGYNWLLTNPSLNPPSGFLYLLSFHDLAISVQINIFKVCAGNCGLFVMIHPNLNHKARTLWVDCQYILTFELV